MFQASPRRPRNNDRSLPKLRHVHFPVVLWRLQKQRGFLGRSPSSSTTGNKPDSTELQTKGISKSGCNTWLYLQNIYSSPPIRDYRRPHFIGQKADLLGCTEYVWPVNSGSLLKGLRLITADAQPQEWWNLQLHMAAELGSNASPKQVHRFFSLEYSWGYCQRSECTRCSSWQTYRKYGIGAGLPYITLVYLLILSSRWASVRPRCTLFGGHIKVATWMSIIPGTYFCRFYWITSESLRFYVAPMRGHRLGQCCLVLNKSVIEDFTDDQAIALNGCFLVHRQSVNH